VKASGVAINRQRRGRANGDTTDRKKGGKRGDVSTNHQKDVKAALGKSIL